MSLNVNELRAGVVFEDRGEFFLVLSYEHIKMGRGSGNVKVKVRNLISGATVEKSFITGARVADVSLDRAQVQYLYRDGPTSAEALAGKEGFHFMDLSNYEQFVLPERLVSDYAKFLRDGLTLTLFSIGDRPMYIELPKILEYKVVSTGGSSRGNTVGASYKDAQLENGLMVKVPLFIKIGEVIRVDTRSGEYVERAR